MTGSVSSTTASTASAATGSGTTRQTSSAALTGLSNNFSNFLSLLMTQLRNQDPSSPLNANEFTSELVQFSSVEQQIATNTNLTQLIQLTQASQVEQSAGMLGKPVTVNSTQLSLQNGKATIDFTTTTAQPVTIAVYNASGTQIQSATLTSSAGSNTWTWNGKNASGNTMADGAYTVAVTAVGSSGATAQVPFTVTGTATAVQNVSGTVKLQMGGLTVPFSSVVSVGS
jgi:flagellar basal-body rod modification protein FlgD